MTQTASSDEFFMAHALDLAARAWGQTHPNPLVGAIIVESGEIVAEGWHHKAGKPHAEVIALASLKRQPSLASTMYVTLEPCSTCGRTGPCTQAIIDAGIKKVVIGAIDPNPSHAGRGVRILREAGVEVVVGELAKECEDLNLIFNNWIVNQRPLVAAKVALTLDGKFAAASGHSKWVTGEVARRDVMRWRRYFPAIALAAGTVLKDDPILTSRGADEVFCPVRFVLDRSLKTIRDFSSAKLFTDEFRERTVLICLKGVDEELKANVRSSGCGLWEFDADGAGYPDWNQFLERCSAEEIQGVYFEPGPRLATSMLESGIIDYLFAYQAPKIMADSEAPSIGSARQTLTVSQAFELGDVRHEVFGDDMLTRGFLKR